MHRYFTEAIKSGHPEWMEDERGRKKISMMLGVLHEVLNEVDLYEVRERPKEIEMREIDG